MKRKISLCMLVIVGFIPLVGLITSCGEVEPQFKVIESREYTAANQNVVYSALYDKHINGKTALSNAPTIMEPYWNDIWPLIRTEMGKMSSTAAGIYVVIKVDVYKLLGRAYYESDGNRSVSYRLYNY